MDDLSGLPYGTKEAKNDVNVRLAHRGLAVDLKTETPRPEQIAKAVATVLRDVSYLANVEKSPRSCAPPIRWTPSRTPSWAESARRFAVSSPEPRPSTRRRRWIQSTPGPITRA